jgi:hypothetical protein
MPETWGTKCGSEFPVIEVQRTNSVRLADLRVDGREP